jgi:hydrogenase small subunit
MAHLARTKADGLERSLLGKRGLDRRAFLAFCGTMAATLALPESYAPAIAKALTATKRPVLVWLEFQDCAGCTESFLRASNPDVGALVLDTLSINYHETLMAAAGKGAVSLLTKTVGDDRGQYIAIVEGAIPTKDNGVYCTIGGRSAYDIATEVCSNAAAVITVGACAFYGGWPSANPNPTGAVGLGSVLSGKKILNLPGCPPNGVNITATLVHFLTFGEMPEVDAMGRPLFAYGELIHDSCDRRAHFDNGQFVEAWGDEAHRNGWCLYKMGCKGPETHHNCATVRWNDGTSWPIGAGHGCIGCSEPGFFDADTPFYQRLPNVVPGFGVFPTVDEVGVGIVAATAALFAAHGIISIVRDRLQPEVIEEDPKA